MPDPTLSGADEAPHLATHCATLSTPPDYVL
jgi:hypothetical protein